MIYIGMVYGLELTTDDGQFKVEVVEGGSRNAVAITVSDKLEQNTRTVTMRAEDARAIAWCIQKDKCAVSFRTAAGDDVEVRTSYKKGRTVVSFDKGAISVAIPHYCEYRVVNDLLAAADRAE